VTRFKKNTQVCLLMIFIFLLILGFALLELSKINRGEVLIRYSYITLIFFIGSFFIHEK
jgi:hypothetical protein